MAASLRVQLHPPATLAGLLCFLLLCLMSMPIYGQTDSPCNQGRAIFPQIDPRSPFAICIPEVAHRYGLISQCRSNQSEQYGGQIYPLGDISGDGLADWIVTHNRCDTLVAAPPYLPQELLLYKGVRGGVPESSSYERIGPTEIGSRTTFITAGDWDGDHHVDLAVRIQIYGDTSEQNTTDGYDIARLVVFWGNNSGEYSINDTTNLLCSGNMWLGIVPGIGADITGDGVDDLLVGAGSGFSEGHLVPNARLLLFAGNLGKRWGESSIQRSASLQWWNAPAGTLRFIDQDQDGAGDIVFHNNDGNLASLSVLYGKPGGGLPDTTDIQTVEIAKKAGIGYSLFADVTGDRVPDLLCGSGVANVVKVYVGFKGQRLLEQFGSGNDSADAGSEKWWGRPWATIWLPRKINSDWFGNDDQLFDLGDVNLDGVGDVYAFSWPYVVEYNGGENMDSLADALYDITPAADIKTAVNLGDIDGSGVNTLAVAGSGIAFLKPTNEISSIGRNRRLPPGTGKKPGSVPPTTSASESFVLDAFPNPSREEIRFVWHGASVHGSAVITIYDIAGHEVGRCESSAEDGAARCTVPDLPAGTYLAQLRCGVRASSTTIVVR